MYVIHSSLPSILFCIFISIISFLDMHKISYAKGDKNFYFTLGFGFTDLFDIDKYETTDEDLYLMNLDLDLDSVYLFGVGYDFGAIRAETSLNKSVVDIVSFNSTREDGTPVSTSSSSGNIDVISFFLTGYYDFLAGSQFNPYLGAGIGISNVDISSIKVLGINGSRTYEDVGNNGDQGFSYELKLGSSYQLIDNLDIYAEGIYRKITGIGIGGQTDLWTDIDVASWSALCGVRFKF